MSILPLPNLPLSQYQCLYWKCCAIIIVSFSWNPFRRFGLCVCAPPPPPSPVLPLAGKGSFPLHLFHGYETGWNRVIKHLEKIDETHWNSHETSWNSVKQSSKHLETAWNRAVKHLETAWNSNETAWNKAVKYLETPSNTMNHKSIKENSLILLYVLTSLWYNM